MSRVSLEQAADALRKGEVVAYPTETYFGLAVVPYNRAAVNQLVELKSRALGAGISLVIDSGSRVESIIDHESEEVKKARKNLIEAFWPGPLTIVITANEVTRERYAPDLFGSDYSLALRLSPALTPTSLAREAGGVITATSANPKGAPPAAEAEEVEKYFPEIPLLDVLDTEVQPPAAEYASTILDTRALPFSLVRSGCVSIDVLKESGIPIAF